MILSQKPYRKYIGSKNQTEKLNVFIFPKNIGYNLVNAIRLMLIIDDSDYACDSVFLILCYSQYFLTMLPL